MLSPAESRASQAVCALRWWLLARSALLVGAIALRAGAANEMPANSLIEEPLAARSASASRTLFTVCPADQTGIVTENNYAPPPLDSRMYKDPRVWADRYREFEVGAVGTGVAIGDYDGDGRPDIFVVSKTESCRLFRNLGQWKFEDVTAKAGVGDHGDAVALWKQGATFADVNNDGRLDLYVCRFSAPNLLYINQGDGTFKEEAAARGVAVNDASVMGAFCDYDRDGWLDVYVQTNLLNGVEQPNGRKDYLLRNNRDGTFTDVTVGAGIRGVTQGHSATWWDFDRDGWSDIYVANDFAPGDSLYRNNRDGTFTDVIDQVVPHQPYSSMGADLGDVNNDGLIDFFVTDMAATSHQKDQRGMASLRTQVQEAGDGALGPPQYARNALYVNAGQGRMLEAACLAGLAATDWTWAARFEDLDNDGLLDLFITNGMHREVHNLDQLQRLMVAESPADRIRLEKAAPMLIEQNLAFRNLGDLRFEDSTAAWGLDEKGVSFGAAFGDLDGDGDLDLVYTNFRKGVTVLRNDSAGGHRVVFALRGTRSNRFGVGAMVRIETDAGVQVRQLVLARGVVSSSEPVLHFGLGEQARLNRVTVSWPSGAAEVFENLEADRKYTIIEPATESSHVAPGAPTADQLWFEEVSEQRNLSLMSREATIDEISQQPLLPMRHNRCGPTLAVGDLNGDGRDDIVLGGTTLDAARVIIGERATSLEGAAAAVNDGPVLIFDANGDGMNDILVTRGGASLVAGSSEYQPRLWLNDGRGVELASVDALPALPMSAGAAIGADMDQDGSNDLFIGGRVLPGAYPASPRSVLLRNRGGKFEDVTDLLCPTLRTVGMVTAALWTDVDRDGWMDLLVACEWGQIRCFRNDSGQKFVDCTERFGFAAAGSGWWSSLATGDFNNDGRPDYVAGNVGLNTPYQADPAHPVLLFAGDFNDDGGEELVEGYYEGEKVYPRRTRRALGAVIPSILKRFPRNDLYARATLEEVVGTAKLTAAQRFAATELRSGVFLSQSDGTYRFEPLARVAQLAPLQGMVVADFDDDGFMDVFAVQNSYSPVPAAGRFDGGLGVLLRGDGTGRLSVVMPAESGLIVPGDARAVALVDLDADGRRELVVTRNNSTTLVFRNSVNKPSHRP